MKQIKYFFNLFLTSLKITLTLKDLVKYLRVNQIFLNLK
jgi:hypothetical protein